MTDETTITALRDAADTAMRGHHLRQDAATDAWAAAQVPRFRIQHMAAIAAGVLVAAGLATALAIGFGGSEHTNPPSSGSACATNVITAPLPVWARAGFSPAGFRTPHVVSDHGLIIAVLFVDLRVHQPAGTFNKVLWVAKRGFGPLHIRAQLQGTSRTFTLDLPNGPGPSYVDMPAPGCWQMNLAWSGYRDTIALNYAP